MTPVPDAEPGGRGLVVVGAAAFVLFMLLAVMSGAGFSGRGPSTPASATVPVRSGLNRSARHRVVSAPRAPIRAVERVKTHRAKRAAAHARPPAGVLSAVERSPAAVAPQAGSAPVTHSPAAQAPPTAQKPLNLPVPQTSPPTPVPTTPKAPVKTTPKPQSQAPVAFDEQGTVPGSNGGGVQFDDSGAGSAPTP